MRENEMNDCDVQNFDGDDSLGAHDHRRKGNEHGFVLHLKMNERIWIVPNCEGK